MPIVRAEDEPRKNPHDGHAQSRNWLAGDTSSASQRWPMAGLPPARQKPRYTVRRWRPFSRLAFKTFRPPLVFIRNRNPCFRFRRRTLGCHVRFGMFVPHRSNSQQSIIPSFLLPCKFIIPPHPPSAIPRDPTCPTSSYLPLSPLDLIPFKHCILHDLWYNRPHTNRFWLNQTNPMEV
jgi:hypothetical protein